jgi:hypothetical protein
MDNHPHKRLDQTNRGIFLQQHPQLLNSQKQAYLGIYQNGVLRLKNSQAQYILPEIHFHRQEDRNQVGTHCYTL